MPPKKSTQVNEEFSLGDDPAPSITDVLNMLTKMNLTLNNVASSQTKLEARLANLEDRLVKQDKAITELEDATSFNSDEINTIKTTSKTLESNIALLESKSQLIQDDLKRLERYSRKFNLRFIGIPECETPEVENCGKVIKDKIRSALGFDADIENAHRTGKPSQGKPRHIVAKFLRRPERFQVLQQKRNMLKDHNIIVCEDLIPEDLQMRRKLTPYAKEAYAEGKKVRFVNGCNLVIDGKSFTPPT